MLARHSEVAGNVYQAFCDAKASPVKEHMHGKIFNKMGTMFPWSSNLIVQDTATLGDDWWPYGMSANRRAVDLILRYHHEQQITDRLYKIEDIDRF